MAKHQNAPRGGGQHQQPPPVVVNVNIPAQAPAPPPLPEPSPESRIFSFLRRHKIAALVVAGVAGLALLGKSCGTPQNFGSGTPGYQGPSYNQPHQAPAPPAALTMVPPKLSTSAAVQVAHIGNQNWVDVTVTVSNLGDTPVQDLTLLLSQNGTPVTIADTGDWQGGTPGTVKLPGLFGIAAKRQVTLRLDKWTPNVPVKVEPGGNGVTSGTTAPPVSCPTQNPGDNIACTVGG